MKCQTYGTICVFLLMPCVSAARVRRAVNKSRGEDVFVPLHGMVEGRTGGKVAIRHGYVTNHSQPLVTAPAVSDPRTSIMPAWNRHLQPPVVPTVPMVPTVEESKPLFMPAKFGAAEMLAAKKLVSCADAHLKVLADHVATVRAKASTQLLQVSESSASPDEEPMNESGIDWDMARRKDINWETPEWSIVADSFGEYASPEEELTDLAKTADLMVTGARARSVAATCAELKAQLQEGLKRLRDGDSHPSTIELAGWVSDVQTEEDFTELIQQVDALLNKSQLVDELTAAELAGIDIDPAAAAKLANSRRIDMPGVTWVADC